jgi:hypothetical protein
MSACILNTELLLFCMFWPIKVFISNPTLFMGHPQYFTDTSKNEIHLVAFNEELSHTKLN